MLKQNSPPMEGRVKRGVVMVTLGGITGGQLRWWLGSLPARPIMADAAMDRNSLPRPGCMVAPLGDAPGHLQLVVSPGRVPQ